MFVKVAEITSAQRDLQFDGPDATVVAITVTAEGSVRTEVFPTLNSSLTLISQIRLQIEFTNSI